MGEHGLLAGFTPRLVTLLTAGGGLLVAAVVKHADNVLKTATATAIVATCLVTAVTSGALPSAGFVQGMALVIGSMFCRTRRRPARAARAEAAARRVTRAVDVVWGRVRISPHHESRRSFVPRRSPEDHKSRNGKYARRWPA